MLTLTKRSKIDTALADATDLIDYVYATHGQDEAEKLVSEMSRRLSDAVERRDYLNRLAASLRSAY